MARTAMILFIFFMVCTSIRAQHVNQKIDGITMVAPPQPIEQIEVQKVSDIGAGWICLVPYGFQRNGEAKVNGGLSNKWWGEGKEGLIKCIEMAKKAKLKIMVKPQVWVRDGWVGAVSYKKEEDWRTWEESYKAYILSIGEVAAQYNVELFCIGTEYDLIAQQRELYWRDLIKSVRKIYSGSLVYSANWDNYQKIKFWDALDYVGISAYFPLSSMKQPTENFLGLEWKKIDKKMNSFSKKYNKKILFTEYGYMSVDHCADKTWELEAKVDQLEVNQDCQATAYAAMFSEIWAKDYIAGGFLWKWFPYASRREGSREKEYDPQNKQAAQILKKYYSIY